MKFPRPRLPLWFAPHFYYAGAAIVVLLATSPMLRPLLYVAILGAIGLLAATILDLAVGPPRRELHLTREPAEHFALRVNAQLSYALENRSRRLVRAAVMEAPVRTLRFDEDQAFFDAPPRARATAVRPVTPIARGADAFGTMYLWYDNAVGLLRRRVEVPADRAFRVYPDLSAVERYGKLHARNRLVEAGLRRMRLRGQGTEFESLRDWATGDAFRTIDWKATARRGRVMVAQHEVERSQNVMIALDCGRLMTPRLGQQRKFDYAVTSALSLASIAGLSNDKVGLLAFARDIIAASAPRATRSSLVHLSELTYDLEPRFEESNYATAFAYLRGHLHKRSLVVFFTDVIDPVAQSSVLAELGTLARRHVVVCVFMNDAAVTGALTDVPQTAPQAYRAAVALGLDRERRVAAATLARAGIVAIDVPAAKLTTSLIDEYLRIKQRGLL